MPFHDRLGEITVGAGFGTDARRRPQRSCRPKQLISYRLDGSAVEVLLPLLKERATELPNGGRDWILQTALPELGVRVTAANAVPAGWVNGVGSPGVAAVT